jgi:hypothetical protein
LQADGLLVSDELQSDVGAAHTEVAAVTAEVSIISVGRSVARCSGLVALTACSSGMIYSVVSPAMPASACCGSVTNNQKTAQHQGGASNSIIPFLNMPFISCDEIYIGTEH